jgi:hypothetical protein
MEQPLFTMFCILKTYLNDPWAAVYATQVMKWTVSCLVLYISQKIHSILVLHN